MGKIIIGEYNNLPNIQLQPTYFDIPANNYDVLSWDQSYLLKICQAISFENTSDELAMLKPSFMSKVKKEMPFLFKCINLISFIITVFN